MKIMGGFLKGRHLKQPSPETTRPMTGRATEAIFNMLGDISELSVLDVYAGSGVLGIEAISRGASWVTAVERDKDAASLLRDNYRSLGIEDRLELHVQPVTIWSMHARAVYDIVFADPPFAEFDETALEEIAARAGRVFVLRHARRQPLPAFEHMELQRHRRYGNSMVAAYTPGPRDS